MKKTLIYLFPLLILFACNGCDEKKLSHPSTTPGENIGEVYELPKASEEVYKAIDSNLQVYFSSLNGQDYETYVDMAFPGIFKTDEERVTMIETLSDWGRKGLKNYGQNIRLDYVSPGVQLDTTMAYIAFFEGDFTVDFEDHFEGSPETYEGQINGTFTRLTMEWDSVNTQYNGHGIQMVYAITSENYNDFRFINERFIGTDRMGGVIDFDNIKILKQYESAYNNK